MKKIAILVNFALFIFGISMCANRDFENQWLVAGLVMISPTFHILVFTCRHIWPGSHFLDWASAYFTRKLHDEMKIANERLELELKELVTFKKST